MPPTIERRALLEDAEKRVAVYCAELLPPSQTFVRAQVAALRRWAPTLVGDVFVEGGLSLDGLRHVAVNPRRSIAARALRKADEWAERRAGLSLATLALLRKQRPRLVHAHFGTDAVRVRPAVRSLGLPLVVTLHGFDVMVDERVWRAHPHWRRQTYPDKLRALAHDRHVHFIAVSEAIRTRAIALGLPPEKIEVVHIGVHVDAFRPSGAPVEKRPARVLYVGRLVEKKGASYLLRAFEQVVRRVPEAELVIAGDGPLKGQLKATVERLRLPVTFLGSVSNEVVKQQLAAARAFCLPSVIAESGDGEGLPIVVLEAQAAGVPVVTSAQGGRDEGMIDGQTGFAYAERDVDALAAHLIRLLDDDALCARMSAQARAFVCERFDIRACTDKLEELYDRVVMTG